MNPDALMIVLGLIGWVLLMGGLWVLVRVNKREPPKPPRQGGES